MDLLRGLRGGVGGGRCGRLLAVGTVAAAVLGRGEDGVEPVAGLNGAANISAGLKKKVILRVQCFLSFPSPWAIPFRPR